MDLERLNLALRAILSSWPKFKRGFPWRSETDPWKILLAELLLVQTDAAKVSAEYEKIVRALPDPQSALSVGEEGIAELLRPLGLYRQRARWIVKATKFIIEEFGGSVPIKYEELRRVPGVGDYIAAAVAVACGGSAAVLDVNVARVLSRALFGRDAPRRYAYDPKLRRLAGQVEWTRDLLCALLDFAAKVCTARKPRCEGCPASASCAYFETRRGA